jgi:hypothetical protein
VVEEKRETSHKSWARSVNYPHWRSDEPRPVTFRLPSPNPEGGWLCPLGGVSVTYVIKYTPIPFCSENRKKGSFFFDHLCYPILIERRENGDVIANH